jgi:DNA modification methylase
MRSQIHFADNLEVLKRLPAKSINLIYIDPPFNTGRVQNRTLLKTARDNNGDRTGFQGQRYKTVKLDTMSFDDMFTDYLSFLEPRLRESHRVLTDDGCIYFHIDYREVHYCKILLDAIFGRDNFLNEIIWAYDFGGRSKKKWPAKHDNILLYAKNAKKYFFDNEAVDRIPYMAPGLVGEKKAALGKLPTDTWWHTIVPTNSREKTGYPTQKPIGILRRIVQASSRPGDVVLDFFAGSGTTAAACIELDRKFMLIDNNPEAIATMAKRFKEVKDIEWVNVARRKTAVRTTVRARAGRRAR